MQQKEKKGLVAILNTVRHSVKTICSKKRIFLFCGKSCLKGLRHLSEMLPLYLFHTFANPDTPSKSVRLKQNTDQQKDESCGSNKNMNTSNITSYQARVESIKKALCQCDDLKFTEFALGEDNLQAGSYFYLSSLVNEQEINQKMLNQLSYLSSVVGGNGPAQMPCREDLLSVNFKVIKNLQKAIDALLVGETVILLENSPDCYAIPTKAKLDYSIADSIIETSVLGPQTALSNDIAVNIKLIRNYIASSKLKNKTLKVGKYTNSTVSLVYLEDLAPLNVVEELIEKIENIKIDGVLNTTYIEELIAERRFNFFPLTLKTERVDRVIGNLLEGRITLLLDGSNTACILPITMATFFQAPEDYYMKPLMAAFLRFFRYISFIIASTVTPIYVAISVFHYEVIPFRFLIPFSESIASIPFPPLFEALLLEIFAQILNESSSRMAGTRGPVIGILGAVLVGQAAIQANIASPVLVIAIAIGVIASFAIPHNDFVTIARMLKFILLIFGGMF